MKKRCKRAGILVGNIVFIILNLLFLTMLILFITRQGGGVIILEQSYAKQIALIMDSAKPGMQIYLNMENALEIAKEKWGEDHLNEIVGIRDNMVRVRLSDKSGHSYSFFNNITIKGYYYDKLNGYVINT